MPASGVGPVKRMILSMHAGRAGKFLEAALASPPENLRQAFLTFAQGEGVML
jgi:signal transduction protein with GAF and PtsI domain